MTIRIQGNVVIDNSRGAQLTTVIRTQSRVSNSQRFPIGHYTPGETVFELDPTWTDDELRQYFNSNNVSWFSDAAAPGGYAIRIDSTVNVGGAYNSGFPYIPVDTGDVFYMECWIRALDGSQRHYMGSIDYNQGFGSLGGNPGSFGYWVMSNTLIGTTWTKVTGYISGFGTSVGQFRSGTKYWTPQALFNYTQVSGTRACVISGWKVIKMTQPGNRVFTNNVRINSLGVGLDASGTAGRLDVSSDIRAPIYYDSNNTAYFADPASTSRFNQARFQNRISVGDGNGTPFLNAGSPGIWLSYNGGSTIFMGAENTTTWGAYVADNWRFRVNSSGTASATGDMRAPIFYDSNDTSYYIDPNARRSSNINGFSARTKMTLGLTAKYQLDRADYTADINYWIGTMGWGTTDFNTINTWGSGFIDTWSNPGNRPTTAYSHFVGLQAQHYNNGATNGTGTYGFQMVMGGGTNAPLYYRTSWNSAGSWKELIDSGLNQSIGGIKTFTGTGPYTNDWFRNSTSGRGLYNEATARHFYSPGTTYWHIDGASTVGGLIFYDRYNGTQGNATGRRGYVYYDGAGFGLLHQNGGWAVRTTTTLTEIPNRLDTPIMYDSNNTGFYVDPASTSRMNTIQPNIHTSPFAGGNSGINRASFAYSYGFQNTGGWSFPFPDLVLHYHTGIIMAANPSYQGIRFLNDYNDDTLRFQINGGSSYTYKYTWMYTNTTGFYSDTNGWHIEPNTLSSYGSMRLRGSRSGWFGMLVDTGNRPHVMFDGSGNGGFYHETGGRWPFYYQYANNCVGMVGSTTSSAYGLYVSKAIFSTGNVVAFSDARKKQNIVTIDNPLEKINSLRGVYYNRMECEDNKREVGVIAQEVNEVLPEVVTYAEDVDEYGVSYGNLAGLFIEAIKEQNKTIETMREEIAQLKQHIGETQHGID